MPKGLRIYMVWERLAQACLPNYIFYLFNKQDKHSTLLWQFRFANAYLPETLQLNKVFRLILLNISKNVGIKMNYLVSLKFFKNLILFPLKF